MSSGKHVLHPGDGKQIWPAEQTGLWESDGRNESRAAQHLRVQTQKVRRWVFGSFAIHAFERHSLIDSTPVELVARCGTKCSAGLRVDEFICKGRLFAAPSLQITLICLWEPQPSCWIRPTWLFAGRTDGSGSRSCGCGLVRCGILHYWSCLLDRPQGEHWWQTRGDRLDLPQILRPSASPTPPNALPKPPLSLPLHSRHSVVTVTVIIIPIWGIMLRGWQRLYKKGRKKWRKDDGSGAYHALPPACVGCKIRDPVLLCADDKCLLRRG